MTPAQFLASHPIDRPRWAHQEEAFLRSADAPAFYLAMEQRTGKTQPVLDKAAYLRASGRIDALLIVAMPSGAPRNWEEEIVARYPVLPAEPGPGVFRWQASKVKSKGAEARLRTFVAFDGLQILLVNGEATVTDAFLAFVGPWLRRFRGRVFCAYDEGTLLIRAPGNERSKVSRQLRKLCAYRTVLDGTPVGEGPLDLYSQYYFLDPAIIGSRTFGEYKLRYAVWEEGYNRTTGTKYPVHARDPKTGEPIYINLDELNARTAPFTYRVLFRDVFAHVPEPVFSKRYFEMVPSQSKLYAALETEYEAELEGVGRVTAAHVLVRYTRLQQVASGFWPSDRAAFECPKCGGDGCPACDGLGIVEREVPLKPLMPFEENPRVAALRDELGFVRRPAVIWCKFNEDVENALRLCREMGRTAVRYDGQVSEKEKAEAKEAFQRGDADAVVAKTRSAGRAVSFSAAEVMVYYTSEFGLNQRLQSQVRAETGDRRIATQVVDVIGSGTKDEAIVASHLAKRKLSDVVLGERSGKWL